MESRTLEDVLQTLNTDQVKALTKAMVNKALNISHDYMKTILREHGDEVLNQKVTDGSFFEEAKRLSVTLTEDHILQWLKDNDIVANDFVPKLDTSE